MDGTDGVMKEMLVHSQPDFYDAYEMEHGRQKGGVLCMSGCRLLIGIASLCR